MFEHHPDVKNLLAFSTRILILLHIGVHRGRELADVFLSYRRTDQDIVRVLFDFLTSLELDVWFDAKLQSGESFNKEISREVRSARCVVVCWSESALDSDWVYSEASIGLSAKKLVSIAISPFDLSNIPVPFNAIHTDDLSDWFARGEPGALNKTIERISNIVHRPGLAEYVRIRDAFDGTDEEKAETLEQWANNHPRDPLTLRILEILTNQEVDPKRRTKLEKQAKATKRILQNHRKSSTAKKVYQQAARDGEQSDAWRAMGSSPSSSELRRFVRKWREGPLVRRAQQMLVARGEQAPLSKRGNVALYAVIGSMLTVSALIAGAGYGDELLKFAGLQTQKSVDTQNWERALKLNTISAYEDYLISCASVCTFSKQANENIEIISNLAFEDEAALAWHAISNTDDPGKIDEWLENYKGTEHEPKAEERLLSLRAQNVKERALYKECLTRLLSKCEVYLNTYPTGRYTDEVKRLTDELKFLEFEDKFWKKSVQRGTKSAYQDYLDEYADSTPKGRYIYDARNAIAKLEASERKKEAIQREKKAWEDCSKSSQSNPCKKYLAIYPNGPKARDARRLFNSRLAKENDDADWNKAREIDSISSYKNYINRTGQSRHREKALYAISRIAPKRVWKENMPREGATVRCELNGTINGKVRNKVPNLKKHFVGPVTFTMRFAQYEGDFHYYTVDVNAKYWRGRLEQDRDKRFEDAKIRITCNDMSKDW